MIGVGGGWVLIIFIWRRIYLDNRGCNEVRDYRKNVFR